MSLGKPAMARHGDDHYTPCRLTPPVGARCVCTVTPGTRSTAIVRARFPEGHGFPGDSRMRNTEAINPLPARIPPRRLESLARCGAFSANFDVPPPNPLAAEDGRLVRSRIDGRGNATAGAGFARSTSKWQAGATRAGRLAVTG